MREPRIITTVNPFLSTTESFFERKMSEGQPRTDVSEEFDIEKMRTLNGLYGMKMVIDQTAPNDRIIVIDSANQTVATLLNVSTTSKARTDAAERGGLATFDVVDNVGWWPDAQTYTTTPSLEIDPFSDTLYDQRRMKRNEEDRLGLPHNRAGRRAQKAMTRKRRKKLL